MPATYEDLRILKSAEEMADSVWKIIVQWDEFAKEVVGKQLARSADSVGANIAEPHGKFSFGEKIQFLYFSRGSILETKYWLNRTRIRGLIEQDVGQGYVGQLTDLARQLNTFTSGLKTIRADPKSKPASVREDQAEYMTASEDFSVPLFSEGDLNWLQS